MASAVRDLELDLDAFEGPFDLLLTLLLKDAIQPSEIDMAGIVVAFVERLAERDELDLDACGEFLVLIAALLELKARHLFPDEEAELSELEPEEAAEELARRLAEYRRMKHASAWLRERLEERARALLPHRPGAARPGAGAPAGAAGAATARRGDPRAGRRAAACLALAHGPPVPARGAVRRAVPRPAPAPAPLRLRRRGAGPLARRAGRCVPRPARAAQGGRDRDLAGRTRSPRSGFPAPTTKGCSQWTTARSA